MQELRKGSVIALLNVLPINPAKQNHDPRDGRTPLDLAEELAKQVRVEVLMRKNRRKLSTLARTMDVIDIDDLEGKN